MANNEKSLEIYWKWATTTTKNNHEKTQCMTHDCWYISRNFHRVHQNKSEQSFRIIWYTETNDWRSSARNCQTACLLMWAIKSNGATFDSVFICQLGTFRSQVSLKQICTLGVIVAFGLCYALVHIETKDSRIMNAFWCTNLYWMDTRL